jgi:SAM-dependent methyltransferase
MQWSQRAFNNPQGRSSHSSFNLMVTLYKKIGRPVSVLELGCTNGGTLHCLEHRGVEVSRYCGVDISGDSIKEAKLRFKNKDNVQFVKKDFIDYLNSTNDSFDILYVRWTFFYLDQEYLEELIDIISRKENVKRILVSETFSASHHSKQSVLFYAEGVPLEYSHNYSSIFDKFNYRIEIDSSRESVVKEWSHFEAVLIHSSN